jgi:hypothetical protein
MNIKRKTRQSRRCDFEQSIFNFSTAERKHPPTCMTLNMDCRMLASMTWRHRQIVATAMA